MQTAVENLQELGKYPAVVVLEKEQNQCRMKNIQLPVQHDPTPVLKIATKTAWQ
jgi:hypothetical protein